MQKNPIQIIYASASGNVETVCQYVADMMIEHGLQVSLHRAEQTPIEIIINNDKFILATSTWEHGVLSHFFDNLHEQIKKMDLSGKSSAFIGLGDIRYEPALFCKGMDILRESFLAANGIEIFHPIKINGEPYPILETTIREWGLGLIEHL